MRLHQSIVLLFALLAVAHDARAADYTGFWKTDCADNFGVQIKHMTREFYSISFCGIGGCFEPGTWKANSRIEGDPTYKVYSSTRIGIRREGGEYLEYQKCTNDPTWITEQEKHPEQPVPSNVCAFTEPQGDVVTIGWLTGVRVTTQFGRDISESTTTVGAFRPLVSLKDARIEESSGSNIHNGQHYWDVLRPKENPVELTDVGSFLDHIGDEHCVYFAGTTGAVVTKWRLLSSKPLGKVFRAPAAKDESVFRSLNKACVEQGDYPEGKAPPCQRPTLLGISDIDSDGKLEYWATEPYKWDTGLTVWELDHKLVPVLEICVGCSD